MTNIKKRIVSMILALCMIFTMVPVTHASAAAPRYYTVEKYDSEGNGTMLVNPTVSTSWSGSYGDSFVKSLLGSDVKVSDGYVTGIKDDSQEDGWLDNGDMGEGSKWIVAVGETYDGSYSNNCYDDASWFSASDVEVIRFIYVPGGEFEKAGLTTEGGNWATVGTVKVDKNELIKVMTDYDPANLGGNRLKAYNEAAAMVLNTTDATAESVAAALTNLQTATDSATGISISEDSAELYVGQKQELTAVLEPLGSTDKLTWTSSDENVVVVEDGVLKGMSAGTATVTVTAENPEVKDSIDVTVNGLQSLYICSAPTSNNVIAAETEELILTAYTEPDNLQNLDWQWSVEDDAIAEVTPMEGNEYMASVKGKKEGKTNVVVTLGSLTSSFEVEVTPYNGPYVYFEYADGRDPQLLDENDTITLTCLDEGKFVVGNSSGTTTWSGGNAFVTSIQGGDDLSYWVFVNKESGKWSPWDVRTLDMSVDSGGWSKSFKVNCVSSGITELKNYVNGTEVTVDDPYVTEGKISGVGVTTKGKNADGEWVTIPTQALHYSTSDTTYNFRWVGNQMSITSGGQATMSVFMRDDWSVKAQFVAKCTYVPLTGFTVETPETFTITGERDFMTGYYYGLQLYSDNLKTTFTPSNATNTELIWESLTPDVAFYTTDHNSGIVPLKCGTAKFKVTSQDNSSLTQEVTVKFLYQYPLESAELAQTEYEMEVGDTQALEITTTPENATEKGFSYSYDKEGIVEVKDGTIIAKSAGEVTVTGTPLDDTMGCSTLTFTVKVTGEAVEQDDPTAIVADGIAHGLSYLENRSVSAYGDEWTIFTVLRAGGSISDENQAAYLDSVEAKLTANATENRLQPTDYVRMVLTLGVMGEDPEDFRGFNLVEKLYTWKNLDYLTSNQISWTLLALDSRDYDIPEDAVNSREQLIEWLLLFQMDDGGFALTDSSDVDMTGMIMQALAPYNNENHPEVQAAFTKALTWLQTQINVNAGFAENAEYNENSCTTAQVLTALAVAGIDPLDPANGLTVGKKNVVTNLYSYKADTGFYWDPTQEKQGNAMATQQVTYALEAYRRFAAKKNSLYDLTDVNPKKEDGPVAPVVAGTITVAVERFSIGQGYLIEPYTTEFYEGETYADICVRILEDNGYTPDVEDSSYGFYLAGIHGADAGTISIPECISLLGENVPTNDAVNDCAGNTMWLGEFSYSYMSGWTYSVGNDDGWAFPNVGMAGKSPVDGDVYRLQFTLWGFGTDLTGKAYSGSPVYYEVGDKTDLTREIALINQNKESWFEGAEGRESAYNHAMEVLQKLDATQAELDAALNLLKNPVNKNKEAAEAFTKQVEALPAADKLKLTDKAAVEAARKAYNELSAKAKEYVTEETLNKLTAVEAAIAKLEAADKADKEAKAAAEAFTKKVEALPAADKLKLTDKAAVEAARKAYEDLSAAAKEYVTKETLNTLSAAEAAIAKLEAAEQEAQKQAEAKAAFESGKPVITVKAEAYNKVKVTWKSYTNATGYFVYRKASGESEWTRLGETTGLSYTDKNASGETTYSYTVKAASTKWGGKVYSKYASSKKVTTPADPAKTAFTEGKPVITVKAQAYNQIKVTWTKYTNATGYRVYRRTSDEKTWSPLGEVTGLSYTDKKAATGTTYYYTVKAVSTKWGGKTYSQYGKSAAAKTSLGTVSIKTASAGYSSVKVSWTKISGASGYEVYRATSKNGTYKLAMAITKGSTVSYTDSKLTTGKTYYYKVRAYRTVNGKKVYGKYSAIKSAKPVPAKVTISSVKNSRSKQAAVTWKKVSGASGYVVYRATSKNGTYKAVGTVKSGSTVKFTNTELKKGKTYYYKVRAYRTVNGKKVYGSYSEVKSVKITK